MSLPHDSSHTHVAGLSEFVDDRKAFGDEVAVEPLFSPYAHAKIKAIDTTKAKQVPGVLGIYTAKDLAHNVWGTIFKDQPLLADKEVQFAGETVALVAAINRDVAVKAKLLIEVKYQELPAVLTIDEAKTKKSFIAGTRKIERGDVEKVLKHSPYKIEDRIVIRGQDHFYLESQVAVAYPKEDGQIEVHSSAQHPTEVQHVVAHGLGLPDNKVACIVKRMGGAFGGKESQAAPYAAYSALVAQKLGRPARICITKDDDMVMTGKRNPFENIYRVGFDKDGKILALDAQLFSDGGAYADLSTSIMERAMLHIDNAYFISDLRVTGQVCKTNMHPHTAFRGFGGPKGVATIERIIEQIAHTLKMDPLDVRKKNCYTDQGNRNITPYGQTVENNCLPELFSKLEADSDYRKRREAIEKHNRNVLSGQGGLTLKGLSLTPVKFGISFTTRFLNQANALVIIHRDSSLQVSTGATEMGQGVNARISQLVANELGIPRNHIQMMPTSTDKNANTSPTAASSGTDLNGAAAILATRRIKYRLSQVAKKILELPEEKWAGVTAGLGTQEEIQVENMPITNDPNEGADWNTGIATYFGIHFENEQVYHQDKPAKKIKLEALINEAYLNRVSLSEYAHYHFPHLTFNKIEGKGRAFLYYTQGTAVSEVSVDLETGEVKVDRVDILMDLGRPINHALDEGQVSGGFVQGMGWVTTEKLYYDKGFLRSHSPSTYKIPNIQDTPRTFNIKLFNNNKNFPNVRGTKAAGEPPLLLAISVWTAIHDALKTLPSYKQGFPQMELPATNEEILKAALKHRFQQIKDLK